MHFIEKNSFNVRSAIYHLKKDGSDLEFLLFPMVHIGSSEFFQAIGERLANCDLILAEGVKSRRANLLTLSYRIVKRIKGIGLVTQKDGLSTKNFKDKILNTDMNGEDFDNQWRTLPIFLRLQLFILIPIYAIYLLFFGSKEKLAQNIALNDLPSSDEIILQDDRFEKFDNLIINERDRKLIENIENLHNSNARKVVGVVYGAKHMRNTIKFLLCGLNYKVVKAEWVTVFEL